MLVGMSLYFIFFELRACFKQHFHFGYRTRAVQKLLENLTSQHQISLIMSALTTCVVALTKDMNGHRVIQCCLKLFSDEDNKVLSFDDLSLIVSMHLFFLIRR